MSPVRILLAEDDPVISEAVEARLTAEGYSVRRVADGMAAVQSAREDRPDLILLDILMPKINGMEVCRILKADPKTQASPIVIVTALAQIKDAEKAFEDSQKAKDEGEAKEEGEDEGADAEDA